MSSEKNKLSESDIARLIALKKFEKPSEDRLRKNIQNTIRAVRTANPKPSLLHFPDQSVAWMFAQPRYGIAALFILFIGLAILEQPMPTVSPSGSGLSDQTVAEIGTPPVVTTNNSSEIPGMDMAYPSLSPAKGFTAVAK